MIKEFKCLWCGKIEDYEIKDVDPVVPTCDCFNAEMVETEYFPDNAGTMQWWDDRQNNKGR